MKVLVFSDTHLTNQFDKLRFEAMRSVIEQADKVIINGDFWDGYVIKFADFLESSWQELFPLLKAKQTVYVHGNHDRPEFTDERVHKFSVENTLEYKFKLGEFEYIITHGHLISPALDGGQTWRLGKWRFGYRGNIAKIASKLTLFLESLSTRIFGIAVFHIGGTHNIRIKAWARRHLAPYQRIICGHSHTAEINNRRRFYNCGAFNHGAISCLWVSEEGVKLVRKKY